MSRCEDVVDVYAKTIALWPDAPPFSGGSWDSWPARLAEGLAFCKSEMHHVQRL